MATRRFHRNRLVAIPIVRAAREMMINGIVSLWPWSFRKQRRVASTGKMRLDGDPSQMGDWRQAIHDAIVDRTS